MNKYLDSLEKRWLDRFWRYVHKTETCWLWQGFKDEFGYGRIRLGKVSPRAHRISYEMANGSIGDSEIIVRHTCDIPACVNPAHLITGTKLDNARDRDERGRSGTVGIKNHKSKLTEEQVKEIRKQFTGERGQATKLMKEFNITAPAFYAIVRRTGWKHVE